MGFTKATKKQSKLRAALFGPSGAGKTYSALAIATGMAAEIGSRIAVIDTEHGSASKYADKFDFDVMNLTECDIDGYCDALIAASDAGYQVVVIDSMSHGWQELLAEVDRLAKRKYGGNTWSAWSDGTPKQKQLVNAILGYPGHVIATMRSKTEWNTSRDNNGKTKIQRVGLAPEQGKGIEYEFDLLMEINTDHDAEVIKDRTGKFQDDYIKEPGEDFGRKLIAWLNEGEEVVETPPTKPEMFTYLHRYAEKCDAIPTGIEPKDAIPTITVIVNDCGDIGKAYAYARKQTEAGEYVWPTREPAESTPQTTNGADHV